MPLATLPAIYIYIVIWLLLHISSQSVFVAPVHARTARYYAQYDSASIITPLRTYYHCYMTRCPLQLCLEIHGIAKSTLAIHLFIMNGYLQIMSTMQLWLKAVDAKSNCARRSSDFGVHSSAIWASSSRRHWVSAFRRWNTCRRCLLHLVFAISPVRRTSSSSSSIIMIA